MSSMFNQYKQKKKRAINPDAPPRPTLLGQVKELKDTKSSIEGLQFAVDYQRREIDQLKSKIRRLEIDLGTVISFVRRNKGK